MGLPSGYHEEVGMAASTAIPCMPASCAALQGRACWQPPTILGGVGCAMAGRSHATMPGQQILRMPEVSTYPVGTGWFCRHTYLLAPTPTSLTACGGGVDAC